MIKRSIVLFAALAVSACGGSSAVKSLPAEINASSCDAMLRQPRGEENEIIPACRSAGFDPVWEIKSVQATSADYDAWRKGTAGSDSPSSGDISETQCPGSARYVVYNGTSTARYGDMTAELPSGTSQQSPDLPIKLKSDATPKGLHFCASPDQFLYVSFQNPTDSGQISCTIEVDGNLVASNKSSGGYTIVTCQG